MIFVVLGTWQMPFERPLKAIEELCKKGVITDEVIVQSGHTNYQSSYFKTIPFIDKSEFNELFAAASFVIVQAGIGSIMHGLKYNKKVISITRLEKYAEHIDDHQLDILNVFSEKGYVKAWREEDNLEEIIKGINAFTPVPYPFMKEEKISEKIIEFIEGL